MMQKKKNASNHRRVNVSSDLNFRKINRTLIGFGEPQIPTGLVQRPRSGHIDLFLIMYDPGTAMKKTRPLQSPCLEIELTVVAYVNGP